MNRKLQYFILFAWIRPARRPRKMLRGPVIAALWLVRSTYNHLEIRLPGPNVPVPNNLRPKQRNRCVSGDKRESLALQRGRRAPAEERVRVQFGPKHVPGLILVRPMSSLEGRGASSRHSVCFDHTNWLFCASRYTLVRVARSHRKSTGLVQGAPQRCAEVPLKHGRGQQDRG